MKQPFGGYNPSAFDLLELVRRHAKWYREAPSWFSKLHKQVREWPRRDRSRASVLRFLNEAKKDGLEAEVTGPLAEAVIGTGYVRQAVAGEKGARVSLLRKAVASLAGAVPSLLQLADLDEKTALGLRWLGWNAAQEQAEAKLNERRRLAKRLMEVVVRLEQERRAVQKYLSTRRLGSTRRSGASSNHANLEWLLYLRRWLGPKLGVVLSYHQLALLIDAARLAWTGQETDTDPDSLERNLDRFCKRNPDFISLFTEST